MNKKEVSMEPVAKVEKHTGALKDMAIIVWTGDHPPEGTKLYSEDQLSKTRYDLYNEGLRDGVKAGVAACKLDMQGEADDQLSHLQLQIEMKDAAYAAIDSLFKQSQEQLATAETKLDEVMEREIRNLAKFLLMKQIVDQTEELAAEREKSKGDASEIEHLKGERNCRCHHQDRRGAEMPVADAPVHDLTRKTTAHPGCFNRNPYQKFYYVKNGYTLKGLTWKMIPHVLTTDCQVAKDPRPECTGCYHLLNAASRHA